MPEHMEKDLSLRVMTLTENEARLWHASLRLWMWRWQTLSPADRAVFYSQPTRSVEYRMENPVLMETRLISFGEGEQGPFVRYNNGKGRLDHVSRYTPTIHQK